MAVPFLISHITPFTFFYFLLLSSSSSSSPTAVTDLNITSILSSFQNFTSFASLLSSTSVLSDLTRREDPITLLAVPNLYLSTPPSSDLTRRLPPSSLGDILRYHILLQYFSWTNLLQIPPSGVLVTTLLQTTGRAPANFGAVNITRNPLTEAITIQSPAPYTASNATVLSLIKSLPYNITILAVNSLIVPYDFNLMASETRPPLGLNITKTLIDGHNFNVAAALLSASGVVDEFESDEGGAGITLFVPTDGAFGDLPGNLRLQSLPADKKSVVLKFHVLHSYYPLGSLESIVNPVQPTLATEDSGAGSFTLNISRVNGSVAIDTGIVLASVTQTVFDQNPVAIFGVSKVLLPREIFGKDPPGHSVVGTAVHPPELSPSPEKSAWLSSPASSPVGFHEEIKSDGQRFRALSSIVALYCMVLYLMI
ncbi:Fasciclin-like arabinogalactan protein 4 [Hibiscus syriacus]|uniref:Fasciclin-like arabinogalactan protein 4 n=1 Tax=Hibiscus syriacus TaxID=106335 RepID=A0A6A2YM92_HIBSY|nr:fasciclin-like arabinogalactan protein 4 [Hibiscus syriacus]KAE8680458.1 Fasciclin-like arabinogalactan protein 4 [Hibiscus syriacus]